MHQIINPDILMKDGPDEVLVEDSENLNDQKKALLLVYDDDFNGFDWLIQCLEEVCDHSLEQSKQLTSIVHHKGKAIVKQGGMRKLKEMQEALINRGFSAVIERSNVKQMFRNLEV